MRPVPTAVMPNLMSNYLARLISAFRLATAHERAFRYGPDAALHRLSFIEKLVPLRPVDLAYKAQLLLSLDRKAEADDFFAQALKAIGQPKSADARYVQIICLLWRGSGFEDLNEADRLWLEAITLPCSNMLREYLLLFDRAPSEVTANPTRITFH